jgi:hypothetical protein
MPPIFKALATITAWFLFILGLALVVIDGLVLPLVGAPITMTEAYFATGLGIASLILSVVAMKLRKML